MHVGFRHGCDTWLGIMFQYHIQTAVLMDIGTWSMIPRVASRSKVFTKATAPAMLNPQQAASR